MTAPGAVVDPLGQLWPETQAAHPPADAWRGAGSSSSARDSARSSMTTRPWATGRAIALLCAREGARVACVDISREAAEATRDTIVTEGGQAIVEVGDVADGEQLAPLLDRCTERLGGLDGLVLVRRCLAGHAVRPTEPGAVGPRARDQRAQQHAARPARPGDAWTRAAPSSSMSSLAALRNASPEPVLRDHQGRAGRARSQCRGRGAAARHQVQLGAAGPHGHADGPGRQPPADGASGGAAPVRAAGDRLGGRLCDVVPAVPRVQLRQRPRLVVDGGLHVGAARQPSAPTGR